MNEPTMKDTPWTKRKGSPAPVVRTVAAAGALALLAGCHVTVDPIRVEPIHLTLDITLKVDRELDRFFDFEDPGPTPGNDASPAESGPEGEPS